MTLLLLTFFLNAKFGVGAVVGAVVALVLNKNLSAKSKAAIQADLDQANAKIKDLTTKK